MIKQIAWNTFKNTGDINSFLEFMELENIEKSLNKIDNNNEQYLGEDNKEKWDQLK